MELQFVWGWQPALYLFLGGMGAGAFVMAAVLYLKGKAKSSLVMSASMWAAAVSLMVGLLLLLMELITPVRGLLMWQSFSHFTSWMTYGAWGAFGAIVVFCASALLAMPPVDRWLTAHGTWYAAHGSAVRSTLAVIGMALGVFVAFYTGMLLMSAGSVPLWDTPLLPALFTVSAFDTGVALVEIVTVALAKKDAVSANAKRLMERSVVVLVLVEVLVMVAFFGTLLASGASDAVAAAASASATELLSGQLAVWFWGLVAVVGLALPLVMAVRGLCAVEHPAEGADDASAAEAEAPSSRRSRFDAVTFVGAAGALVGGCALRFLILAAGVHADVVSETIFRMIN